MNKPMKGRRIGGENPIKGQGSAQKTATYGGAKGGFKDGATAPTPSDEMIFKKYPNTGASEGNMSPSRGEHPK